MVTRVFLAFERGKPVRFLAGNVDFALAVKSRESGLCVRPIYGKRLLPQVSHTFVYYYYYQKSILWLRLF